MFILGCLVVIAGLLIVAFGPIPVDWLPGQAWPGALTGMALAALGALLVMLWPLVRRARADRREH